MKDRLNLGELIEALEKMSTHNDDGDPVTIRFDFGSAIPTTLDSWRGDYSHLALGYELTGYDGEGDYDNCTVESLLNHLKSSIGETFHGWKGGEYVANADKEVWIANSGNFDNTAIVGLIDQGHYVVIETAFEDY